MPEVTGALTSTSLSLALAVCARSNTLPMPIALTACDTVNVPFNVTTTIGPCCPGVAEVVRKPARLASVTVVVARLLFR